MCFAIINSNSFIYFKNLISIEKGFIFGRAFIQNPWWIYLFKRSAMIKTFSPISRGSLSVALFRSPCFSMYLPVLLSCSFTLTNLWNSYMPVK